MAFNDVTKKIDHLGVHVERAIGRDLVGTMMGHGRVELANTASLS